MITNQVKSWLFMALVTALLVLLTEEQTPDLYALVRKLTQAAGLPMPKLYVTPSDEPNAFATGRDPAHAAVAVTTGLLRTLGGGD